jgi:endogenous inhibitor of DNA gyrase (YacG/DUF329 family)
MIGQKRNREVFIRNCAVCGKDVRIPFYRLAAFKCCSRKCLWQFTSRHQRVDLVCSICKAPFEVPRCREKTARYCSRPCYYRAMAKIGSVESPCARCGVVVKHPPSHQRKFCSRRCKGRHASETRTPKWSTGVRRQLVRLGDLVRCERCGYGKVVSILGVHHKNRNPKDNRRENLEVLCPNCHSEEHGRHTPHRS